jgi:Zn-dependent protease
MANTESASVGQSTAMPASASAVGGAIIAILGLLHLFVAQVGGALGVLLLVVVWPLVGGAVAAYLTEETRQPRISGLLSGAYAGFVVGLVVLLAGLANLWTPFITNSFGVAFWGVVFSAWLTFLVSWTVFGFTGGYAVERALES